LALAGRELFVFGVQVVETLRPKHDPELVSRMQEIEESLLANPEHWQQLKAALRKPEANQAAQAPEDSEADAPPELEPAVAGYVEELRSRYSDEELARYVEPPSLLTSFDLKNVPLLPKVIDFAEKQLSDDQLRALQQGVLQSLQGISTQVYASTIALAKNLLIFLVGLFIVTLALYYFFAEGPRLLESAQRIVPIDPEHQQELYRQFETVCRAVVLATLTSALVQGLMAGAAYWVAGVPWVWLLMLLTILCAMIPVGGAALVWVPVTIWLLVQERYLAGGLMAVYGVGGISAVDNLIKPYVIQGRAKLHPLLVFVSVLGALRVIGLWGIFIGPIVAAVFYSLLRILHDELNRDKAGELISAASTEAARIATPKGSGGPSADEGAAPPEQARGAEAAETEPGNEESVQRKPDADPPEKR
jgi:predicted PurR-regulated permease PerM